MLKAKKKENKMVLHSDIFIREVYLKNSFLFTK